jgi:hypothetical protein
MAGAEEERAMANRLGKGLSAGLAAALFLLACGSGSVAEELAPPEQAAPDSRAVQAIPVRPPGATSPVIRTEVRRRTTPRRPTRLQGDFWMPGELHRVQPHIGDFPTIKERRLHQP